MAFIPCPACDRHVRTTDRTCPFCSTTMPEATIPAAAPGRALTRAAILFAGATAVSACSSPEPVAMYGPAPVDASSDVKDSSLPDVVAMYGPSPVDAGPDVSDAASEDASSDATDEG